MPAAVPLAIVGSSIISGVASSNASKSTAKAAENTAAANNALQLQIYNQNKQAQQPYLQGGNRAWDAWQSFMGLTQPAPATPATQPITGQPQVLPAQNASPLLSSKLNGNALAMRLGEGFERPVTGGGAGLTPTPPGQTATTPGTGATPPPAGNALSGYDMFKQSMGYQTGLTEGMRSLNARLATGGRLFSGDAGREAVRYGQEYAHSFAGDYLGQLMNGAQMGAGAANALAGVGSNYANASAANNNAALNARANANAATAGAIGDAAANAGTALGYYYGNRAPAGNALGSSYSGYGRPIMW